MSHIFSYTVLDDDGNERALPIYCTLLGTLTLTQLEALSTAISAIVDNVTDGKLLKGSLTLSMPLDAGVKASPVAGSNVQESGLIQFEASGTPYTWSIDIPAFIQAAFTGKTIDLSNADVVDFTGLMITPASGFTGSDKYDNALVVAKSGKKTFRKQRA